MKTTEKIFGLKTLRENMEKYIGEVKRGKSFIVVRRSTPVFKVAPAVDEWGDEGVWETILDLTKGREKLISADKLLAAIKRFNARQNSKVSPKA